MSALAIILARGGSKRIPRKNIRPFHGRPILAYPIAAAQESGCFDEIMVSTEDEGIADLARAFGAAVPFLRSGQNATDFAGSEQVMSEVILKYRSMGRDFSHVCAIYATAALTTTDHLRHGYAALLADDSLTTVLPTLRFSFPIQRALVLREGRTHILHPEYYETRSQDLELTCHDAGQWYWFRTERFLRTLELAGPNCSAIEISEMEAQDIDTEDDWAVAELKFELRRAGRAP